MVRRRVLTPLVAAAAVAAGCGGASHQPAAPDPGREALAYVSPREPLVVVVSTDFQHGQGKAARQLLVPGVAGVLPALLARLHLDPAALGHDVVIAAPDAAALRGHDLLVSAVSAHSNDLRKAARKWQRIAIYRGATLYKRAATVYSALRGSVLLVADNPAELHRALDLRARGGGLSPTALRERLGVLPAGALVRVVGDARALISGHRRPDPFNLVGLRWVRSFRRFAATVSVVPTGVRLRLHVDGDPRGLDSVDVPVAAGTIAKPTAAGAAPLVAAIGDGAHLLAFLERAYGQVDRDDAGKLEAAKAIARVATGVDVDDDIVRQVGSATLLSRDLRHFTLRAELRDPARVAHALAKLEPLAARFLDVAALHGFALERQPGRAYLIRQNGRPYARFAVIDRLLVFTTDPAADLQAVAKARPAPLSAPAPGSLVARLQAPALRNLVARLLHLPALARLALVDLRGATAAVQATTSHLDATVSIAVAR